jgi:hypothetical protein
MFRGPRRRLALSCAALLALASTIAAASPALAIQVKPGQFFTGYVFGTNKQSVIEVACLGPGGVGRHPLGGQTVEVVMSPVPDTTVGYTGGLATEINAALSYASGPGVVTVPIATFTQYSVKLPIPTSIQLPCSGSGVMSLRPYPLDSGRPVDITVTFQDVGF